MALCTLTGTLYLPSGAVAPYGKLRVVKAIKSGIVILADPTEYTADASGVITFTAEQGSTIYVHANAPGFDTCGAKGVPLIVPSASSATLESIAPATSVPGSFPVAVPGGGYQSTLQSAATSWTITHGLGSRPLSVTLYDASWNLIYGEVDATSTAVVTVTFNVAQSGYARIV